MRRRKEFLGRGWAFPFRFDAAKGTVALSQYEENIRQCITVILGTRPGERQMLPKFGCRIHECLFAPNTRATSGRIERFVTEALTRWEPRIEVTGVRAIPTTGGEIKVELNYRIISTNTPQNLVYVMNSGRRS